MPREPKPRFLLSRGPRTQPYACPLCAAAFGREGNMRKHVRSVHEKRKDHACTHCSSAVGTASSLTTHVRTVHEKRKDHACPHCAAAFGTAGNLTVHVRTVHEKRTDHSCPHCAAAFGTADKLLPSTKVAEADAEEVCAAPMRSSRGRTYPGWYELFTFSAMSYLAFCASRAVSLYMTDRIQKCDILNAHPEVTSRTLYICVTYSCTP
jgi:hypothetical protein